MRLFTIIVAAILVTCTASPAAAANRPNVLFIAVDDLRPQMRCYGEKQMVTPHLDRLAERGVRFDRAYCNIAVCGASRASLMSGLRPTPTRFTSYLTRIDKDAPDVPSLPMTFKQAGYYTVTNGKVYHQKGDDARAWSEPDWRPDKSGLWYSLKKNRDLNTARRSRGPAYEAAEAPDDQYPDYDTATKTINDLQRLSKRDEPFFLACGFFKPHLPFVAPKKYYDLYDHKDIRLPGNMQFPVGLSDAFAYSWGEMRAYHGIPKSGPVSNDAARQLIHHYYACVSFVDAQVGRLLDEVDRLGIADNTIIILWGDHGWQLGEHGFWCKHTNFEVATRVPLIVVAPGMAPAVEGGRACERLVEFIDLYPTLCDLAGLEKPDHLQGKSMAPLLKDVDAAHKDMIFTRHGGGDAVRDDRYRYMEMRADRGRGELRGVGFFDLQTDPQENTSIAADPVHARALYRLRDMLNAVRRGAGP